ncbi:hypothetical protein L1987_48013 [Smallanthus sonchifolius]|uniref:Uncharacterized protein n=1 Tax=Smallanthus sonchifolius TaxID=185202 RepID=A0ACB9FQ60_9ASTR|nr:hypothetical protein L1987_48013 [Smallanthus sonchifolius]
MGVYLSTPKTEKFSQDGENENLRYGVSSMQGWRTSMEDAVSQAVSKFCAKYLHQQVIKHEAYSSGDIGTAVQKSFIRMDEMMRGQRGWRELAILGEKIDKFSGVKEGLIGPTESGEVKSQNDDWFVEEKHLDKTPCPCKSASGRKSGPTCGSTACVAIIRSNQLVVANSGDSRCVISRKGQAYNLSKDHKPDLESEKERISKAGGFIHCGRVNGTLNLTRAIGDMELKKDKSLPAEKQILTANPDINTVELCEDDDFLVLACDGIWDCMSNQQLVDFVLEQLKTESKLSTVCEKVFDRCLAPTAGGEGCDNMTMILVQFKKHPNPVPSTSEQQPSSDSKDKPGSS